MPGCSEAVLRAIRLRRPCRSSYLPVRYTARLDMQAQAEDAARPGPARRGEEGRGLLLVLLAAAAYGSMPIVGKLTYAAGVRPNNAIAWRFAVAVLVFALIRRRGEAPLPRRKRLVLWGLGLVFVVNALAYFAALA